MDKKEDIAMPLENATGDSKKLLMHNAGHKAANHTDDEIHYWQKQSQ